MSIAAHKKRRHPAMSTTRSISPRLCQDFSVPRFLLLGCYKKTAYWHFLSGKPKCDDLFSKGFSKFTAQDGKFCRARLPCRNFGVPGVAAFAAIPYTTVYAPNQYYELIA